MTRAKSRLNPQLVFVALALGINILVLLLARQATGPKAHSIAVGAVLDMTVTVPALYYWLVVRPGLRNLASLGLIALLSLWRAAFAFPEIIPGKVWIGAATECLMIAAVWWGIRRARSAAGGITETDPVARIQAAVRGILPFSSAERVLTGELAVLYYGLAWRAKPDVNPRSQAFTLHRRSAFQDILLFVGLASLLEILPVHLLLNLWRPLAAWVATGLSLYGAFWAVSMSRAFELRPSLVSAEEILLRFGLLAQLRIPVSAIRAATREIPEGSMVMPRRTPAELYIGFNRPLEIEKLLGFRQTVSGIAVSADQGAEFESALRASTGHQRLSGSPQQD